MDTGSKPNVCAYAEKKSIVVDFDGTIATNVGHPDIGEPIEATIELMRKAKDAGLEVVIQSCRWSKGDWNTAEDAAQQMVECAFWLDEHDVPYDRLEAGKPLAIFYLDDKAVRPDELELLESLVEKNSVFSKMQAGGMRLVAASSGWSAWVNYAMA